MKLGNNICPGCCQVATFNSAARKENSQQTQQRNLGQPSQTLINVPLKDQAAGVQPRIIRSHPRVVLCVFIFPAIKYQILNKTGSVICSENVSSTFACYPQAATVALLSDKGSQPSESRAPLHRESLKSMQIHVHLSQPAVCLSA